MGLWMEVGVFRAKLRAFHPWEIRGWPPLKPAILQHRVEESISN